MRRIKIYFLQVNGLRVAIPATHFPSGISATAEVWNRLGAEKWDDNGDQVASQIPDFSGFSAAPPFKNTMRAQQSIQGFITDMDVRSIAGEQRDEDGFRSCTMKSHATQKNAPTTNGATDKASSLDRMVQWLRNNRYTAGIMLIAIALTALGSLTEKLDTTLVFFHLKNDKALALASDNARGELSRNLVRQAWKRMHWTRIFGYRVGAAAPAADLEAAWLKYNEAAAERDTDLMINIKGLAEFYPNSNKGEIFESEIQYKHWREISDRLFNLRYRTPPDLAGRQALAQDIEDRLDGLNKVLYVFTLDEPSPRKN